MSTDSANLVIAVNTTDLDKLDNKLGTAADSGDKLDASLSKVAGTADKLGTSASTTASTVNTVKVSLDELTTSTATVSSGLDKVGTSADTMTRYVNTSKTASEMLKNSAVDLSQKMAAEAVEVQKLTDKYDPLGTKLRSLQADFANMQKPMNPNASASIGAFQNIQTEIDKTQKAIKNLNATPVTPPDLKSLATATEANASAMDHLNFSTVGARRELLVLAHEATQGNWKNFGGSLMVLGERTDAMGAIFSSTGIAVAALVAALVILEEAWRRGAEETKAMNLAMQTTSNYAGLTQGSMRALAAEVSASTTMTIGTTKELVVQLAASGRIGSDALGLIAKSAKNMANATGESVADITPKLIKLFADPAKGAEELNQSMHYLTATELEHIKTLERMGDLNAAQVEAITKLNAFLPDTTKNLGFFAKAWDTVAKAASGFIDTVKGLGRDKTIEEKLKDIEDRIKTINSNTSLFGQSSSKVVLDQLNGQARIFQLMLDEQNTAAGTAGIVARATEANIKANEIVNTSAASHLRILKDQLADITKNGTTGVELERKKFEIMKDMFDTRRSMSAEERAIDQADTDSALRIAKINSDAALDKFATELKLGKITQERFDAEKLASDLLYNKRQQLSVIEQQSGILLNAVEKNTLANKLEELQAEEKLISIKGGNKALTDAYDLNKKIEDSYYKQKQAIDAKGTSQLASLDKEIESLRLKEAEIGKTKAQADVEKQLAEIKHTDKMQQEADELRAGAALDQFYGVETNLSKLMLEQADMLDKEIVKRKIIAEIQGSIAVRQAAADAAKKSEEEWTKVAKTIEGQFHSAFNNIFEKGKGGWKDMVDSFKKMFKNTVIDYIYTEFAKKWVFNIIANIAGTFGASGLAGAASTLGGTETIGQSAGGIGGFLSAGSTLSSAYSAFTGGLSNTYVSAASSGIGQSLGLSTGVSGASAGASVYEATYAQAILTGASATEANTAALAASTNSLTGLGSTVGAGLSYIGAGMAGIAIGTKIAGDKVLAGINGFNAAAMGAVLGGTIGSVVPVIGTAIGAIVGGIIGGSINAAFGHGPMTQSAPTTFKGGVDWSGLQGNYVTPYVEKGGWFSSDKTSTSYVGLGPDQTQASKLLVAGVDSVFQKLLVVAGGTFKSLQESLAGWTMSVDRQLSTDQNQIDFTNELANSIGHFLIPALNLLNIAGENLADTATRITDEFILTNQIATLLGKDATTAFGQIGIASIVMRDSLIQGLGGMKNATSVIQSYYTNFFTDAERHANDVKALQAQFIAIGQVMPDTRAGFRALVDQVSNLGTVAGQDAFLGLMNLQAAFAAVVPAATGAATATGQSTDALTSFMADIAKQAYQANPAITDFNKGLKDLRDTAQASIDQAKSLGASEAQLGQVRDLNHAKEQAYMDAETKRLADLQGAKNEALGQQMTGIKSSQDAANYTLATAGMDATSKAAYDLAKAIADVHTAANVAITAAYKTGADDNLITEASTNIKKLEADQIKALNAVEQARIQGLKDTERKTLQGQLDSLTLNSTQLLAKQRDALYADNQALFDNIQLAEKAKALTTQMQGVTAALAALDYQKLTAGIDAYHKALLDANIAQAAAMDQARANGALETGPEILAIQKLGDATRKGAKDANDLALATEASNKAQANLASQTQLDIQVMQLLGQGTMALTTQRNLELAAIRAAGGAGMEALLATKQLIYDFEDAAAKAAKDKAAADAQAQADAQTAKDAAAAQHERDTYGAQLLDLLGQHEAAVNVTRAASLIGLSDYAKAAQTVIWKLQDQKAQTDALAAANLQLFNATHSVNEVTANARNIKLAELAVKEKELGLAADSLQSIQRQIDAATDLNVVTAQITTLNKNYGDQEVTLLQAEGRAQDATNLQRQRTLDSLTGEALAIQQATFARENEIEAAKLVTAEIQKQAGITSTLKTSQATLEVQLLQVQGKTLQATAAQRLIDIAGMNAANIAAYDYNQTLKQTIADTQAATAAQAAADTLLKNRTNLAIQILELEGNSIDALKARRGLEIAGMDASLVPLQLRIYALTDEAAATAKVNAVAKAQRALDIQLMELTGNASGALAAKRHDELTAQDASLNATQLQIYAAEDAAAAAAEAAKAQAAADAAAAKALAAQTAATNALRTEAEKARTALDNMAQSIRSTISTLLGLSPAVVQQQRVEAKQAVAVDIATLQAGGAAPDDIALKNTLASLSKIDPTQYATFADYQKEIVSTAGILDQLATLVETKRDAIPHYAEGTDFHPGGSAWVGEKGPERVVMPAGSKVYPNGSKQDNADVVNELRAVKAYLQKLEQNTTVSAKYDKKISDTLVRVTRDGNELITKDYTVTT